MINLDGENFPQSNLKNKYGLTGQESPEQIRDVIMLKGYNKDSTADYGAWLKANQTIVNGGQLSYSRRGLIAGTNMKLSYDEENELKQLENQIYKTK